MLGEDRGILEIVSCASGSGCEKAGLEAGDRILSVEGQPVASMSDLKGVLWDRSPGDRIQVEIRRRRWLSGERRLTREVVLQ
jgi:S1-C subfamily serine protease